MAGEIRCKRIIDGKTYNTETSTLLGQWEADDAPIEHALFKTRHGTYFLWASEQADHEPITPLTAQAAKEWIGKHCRAELFEAEFGQVPEARDAEARITLRIPETLRKRIAAIAEKRKQSVNAWIQRCLERSIEDAETTH